MGCTVKKKALRSPIKEGWRGSLMSSSGVIGRDMEQGGYKRIFVWRGKCEVGLWRAGRQE